MATMQPTARKPRVRKIPRLFAAFWPLPWQWWCACHPVAHGMHRTWREAVDAALKHQHFTALPVMTYSTLTRPMPGSVVGHLPNTIPVDPNRPGLWSAV